MLGEEVREKIILAGDTLDQVHTLLYCTVLYCTVLYCTVLYCTV